MSDVIDRFLRYVRVDTQSQPDMEAFPSTEKQKDLGRMLKEELRQMGAEDVYMDEYGYVYAQIPSTLPAGEEAPVVGFLSHMDTSDAVSGRDVHPKILKNYDGSDILLNEEKQIVLYAADFPHMKAYKGADLIVTDGTTLLGGDDKAGIAEIMTMAQTLLSNPQIPHQRVPIAFTPDEEVGRGVEFFDLGRFGADYAYTVDGEAAGSIEYENFNAAGAKVTFFGKSVHPGSAKGVMVNAILLSQELQALLPVHEDPACTDGYEGFYHPTDIRGGVNQTVVSYIIRDHDREKFEKKKDFLLRAAAFLNEKYGYRCAEVSMQDSYYNMKEKILPHAHLLDNARDAIRSVGLTPQSEPVRGGTDGCVLSYRGLPCPNLGTGAENLHGVYEFACIQSMEETVEILLAIVRLYAHQ